MELYNSIPVPAADVNLEDILNFKEHRYNELQEFRCVMDEMYMSIINSPDKDLAKDISVKKLQNKLIELDRIMNESKINRFLSSLKAELDISGIIKSGLTAIGGYELGAKVGFPTTGAVLGFASSMVNIKCEFSLKPKEMPIELKDYAYLYYQNKELK
ncbi:hypothetical protein SDC9_159244 [bioreactor metagenome]|uniref:Uncharacterized protein n=1 Tax=bioreactor metagenome TaxID=1076179 RepID=A0A645FC35_9ZZZZ